MKINYKRPIPQTVEFFSLMQGEIGTHVASGRPFVKITLTGGTNVCFLGGGMSYIGPEEKVIPAKSITIEERS